MTKDLKILLGGFVGMAVLEAGLYLLCVALNAFATGTFLWWGFGIYR